MERNKFIYYKWYHIYPLVKGEELDILNYISFNHARQSIILLGIASQTTSTQQPQTTTTISTTKIRPYT